MSDFGASATIDNLSNAYLSKKEAEINRKMSNKEYKRSRDDWNASNYYNSPKEQMKRLRDAGLNPNLIAGNPTIATKPQNPYSGRSVSVPKVNSQGSFDYLDIRQKQENIALTKATTDEKIEETRTSKIQNPWTEANKELNWESTVRKLDDQRLAQQIFTKYAREIGELKTQIMRNQVPTTALKSKLSKWGLTDKDNALVRTFIMKGGGKLVENTINRYQNY